MTPVSFLDCIRISWSAHSMQAILQHVATVFAPRVKQTPIKCSVTPVATRLRSRIDFVGDRRGGRRFVLACVHMRHHPESENERQTKEQHEHDRDEGAPSRGSDLGATMELILFSRQGEEARKVVGDDDAVSAGALRDHAGQCVERHHFRHFSDPGASFQGSAPERAIAETTVSGIPFPSLHTMA